jgi:hypothetical protein
MGPVEKEILYQMFVNHLMKIIKIPRGSGKSFNTIFMNIHLEALKRTNYCLKAIGDSYNFDISFQ